MQLKMMLLKKLYDKLVAKVNNIDNSGFILKTKYDTDKSYLEKKTPYTNGLVKTTYYDAEITLIGKKPEVLVVQLQYLLGCTKIKYLVPVVQSKRNIITQKLLRLRRILLIIIMINVQLIQNLIIQQLEFLMQD